MPDFDHWNERWTSNETPWIDEDARKRFIDRWENIVGEERLAQVSDVLVPLSGSDVAVHELHRRGYTIKAVEYVPQAVERLLTTYFSDTSFQKNKIGQTTVFSGLRLEIIQGDFFKCFWKNSFDLVYDRAALVAIDPEQRSAYSQIIQTALRPGGLMLLVSLFYEGATKPVVPCSVSVDEVKKLYPKFNLLERDDFVMDDPVEHLVEAGVTEMLCSTTLWEKD